MNIKKLLISAIPIFISFFMPDTHCVTTIAERVRYQNEHLYTFEKGF